MTGPRGSRGVWRDALTPTCLLNPDVRVSSGSPPAPFSRTSRTSLRLRSTQAGRTCWSRARTTRSTWRRATPWRTTGRSARCRGTRRTAWPPTAIRPWRSARAPPATAPSASRAARACTTPTSPRASAPCVRSRRSRASRRSPSHGPTARRTPPQATSPPGARARKVASLTKRVSSGLRLLRPAFARAPSRIRARPLGARRSVHRFQLSESLSQIPAHQRSVIVSRSNHAPIELPLIHPSLRWSVSEEEEVQMAPRLAPRMSPSPGATVHPARVRCRRVMGRRGAENDFRRIRRAPGRQRVDLGKGNGCLIICAGGPSALRCENVLKRSGEG